MRKLRKKLRKNDKLSDKTKDKERKLYVIRENWNSRKQQNNEDRKVRYREYERKRIAEEQLRKKTMQQMEENFIG